MLLRVMFRTVFFYFFVAFSYKLMGKRELGELGVFDFIISILISQLIAISIENYKDTIIYVLVPIIILTILQVFLAYIALKSNKARKILDGNESVIINDGKLNFKEMTKLRYNLSDLFVQLRDKGVKTIEDVEYAILETNGKLSVFEKKNSDKVFPLPLILDGEIEKENLKYINKDEKWVNNILTNKKVKLSNVFYAFYKDSDIYIIKK